MRLACFFGEQILLHGGDADRDRRDALRILEGMDLFDPKRALFPKAHNTVLKAAPSEPFIYVPLVVNADSAERHSHRMGNRSRSSTVRRVQPLLPSNFSGTRGLAFITTWSNAWQETFHRAVTQLFDRWCVDGDLAVIPAAWGSTSVGAEDGAERWCS